MSSMSCCIANVVMALRQQGDNADCKKVVQEALELGVFEQTSCLLHKHGLVAPLYVARWKNHSQLQAKLKLLSGLNEFMSTLFYMAPEQIGQHLLQVNVPTRLLSIVHCFVG